VRAVKNLSLVVLCAAALALGACKSRPKPPAPGQVAAPKAQAAAPMGTLAVVGYVTDKELGIDPVFCVDAPSASPKQGPLKLKLLDAQGKELASQSFDVEPPPPAASKLEPGHPKYFRLLVPKVELGELVIEAPGVPPLRKRASTSAPEIALEPVTEASFLPSRQVRLAWNARDADQDRLFIRLELSADDGKTWRELPGTFEGRSSIDLDFRWIKASDTTRLRATVSDGLRCARDEFGPFVVPKRPPMVRIRQTYKPQIKKADTLDMRVDVGSENGAVDDQAIVWSSSLDGELGRGRTITFAGKDRTLGKHTVTATFTDSAGLTSSHQLDVELVK
jgi:hypothetical protein